MAIEKIGKFQVFGPLGFGAHSTIMHICRSADARNYALKIVSIDGAGDMKFLEQARNEVEVARRLDHSNLIKVHALETQRNWLFQIRKLHLLLEYVNGRTLDRIPRLSVPQLVQIFAGVAAGMAHMHERGVCHADLKPNNIMLSRSGQVKIIDFGLAWIRGENKERVQGTLEYMAPEQARKKIANEQTDIYNFGATMYRLTAGRLPPSPVVETGGLALDPQTWERLLKPVRSCRPEAPAALGELIQRCLAFHPKQRPQRISEVREILDRLAEALVRSAADSLEELEE